jgi:uncharacterized membrane protein
MNKKDLHWLIIYSVLIIFLLFVNNYKWDYELNSAIYNTIITYYLILHIGYISFNYRDFMMTTQMLRENYRDRKLRYKAQTIENGKIHRVYVNDYISDFWYEIDYMLTIPKDCDIKTYNDFIACNTTSHRLYQTMVNKRRNNKEIMKNYLFNKSVYKTQKYTVLSVIILTLFLSTMIMLKKGILF